MKNKILLLMAALAVFLKISAQDSDTNVILISLDGYRWQELFTGADPLLIGNKEYVHEVNALKEAFWRETPEERREALMPFFWTQVSKMGQLHGNRTLGSKVNLTNTMWFSYPGYNEILTGTADDKNIRSNDKIENPNTTILERYNNTSEGKNKVVAFGSWDVFPFIINEKRSGVPVNAGFETATGNLNEREKFLNELQGQVPSPWGSVRLDAFTHHYALEHMKKEHPKLLFISYGETDDFAHDGDYQAYLKSAHNTDALIKELWDFTQQDDFYKPLRCTPSGRMHGQNEDGSSRQYECPHRKARVHEEIVSDWIPVLPRNSFFVYQRISLGRYPRQPIYSGRLF